jgi:hypothetical protein
LDFTGIINWGLSLLYFIEPYLITVLLGVLIASIISLALKKRRRKKVKIDELKPPVPILQRGSNGLPSKSNSVEQDYKVVEQFAPPDSILTSSPSSSTAVTPDLVTQSFSDPVQIHVINILNYDKMLGVLTEQKRTLEHRRSIIENEIDSVDKQAAAILGMKHEEMQIVNDRLGFVTDARETRKQQEISTKASEPFVAQTTNAVETKNTESSEKKEQAEEQERLQQEIDLSKKSQKKNNKTKQKLAMNFEWEDEKPRREDLEQTESENSSEVISPSPSGQSQQDDPASEIDANASEQSDEKKNRATPRFRSSLGLDEVGLAGHRSH